MGFWIFMTICGLLLPLLMILIGFVFQKNPPKTINSVYGYRTTMSRKNQETWDFAHQYCGRLWWKTGWTMLPVSVLIMLFVRTGSENLVALAGGLCVFAQCAILILSILPVEAALKKNFDQNGKRLPEASPDRRK